MRFLGQTILNSKEKSSGFVKLAAEQKFAENTNLLLLMEHFLRDGYVTDPRVDQRVKNCASVFTEAAKLRREKQEMNAPLLLAVHKPAT